MPDATRYTPRQNRVTITAAQFRRWLREAKMSQMECARVLHVDGRTVRAWVRGERAVPGPVIAYFECIRWHE